MTVSKELGRLLGWVAHIGLDVQVCCARANEPQIGLSARDDLAWLGGVLLQLQPLADAVRTGDNLRAIAACAALEHLLHKRGGESKARNCAGRNPSDFIAGSASVDEGLQIVASLSETLASRVLWHPTQRGSAVPLFINQTHKALRSA